MMAKDSNYKKHDDPYKGGTGYGRLWQVPEDPATYINWKDERLKTHFLDGWMKKTSAAMLAAVNELGDEKRATAKIRTQIIKLQKLNNPEKPQETIKEIQQQIDALNLQFAEQYEKERAAGKKVEKLTIKGPVKKMYQMLDFVATGGNKIGNEFKKLLNSALQFYRIASVYASNIGIMAKDSFFKLCDSIVLSFTKGLAWFNANHIDSVRDKQLGHAEKIGGNFDNSAALRHVGLNHQTKMLRNEIEVLEARIDFCEKWDSGKVEELKSLLDGKKTALETADKELSETQANEATPAKKDVPSEQPELTGAEHNLSQSADQRLASVTEQQSLAEMKKELFGDAQERLPGVSDEPAAATSTSTLLIGGNTA